MAVVIRLARAGTKKKPYYHLVVADKTRCRDGKYLARVGLYNPKVKGEGRVILDQELYTAWVKKGAKASETVGHLIRDNAKSK